VFLIRRNICYVVSGTPRSKKLNSYHISFYAMEIYKITYPDGSFYIGKTTRGHLTRFKEHQKNWYQFFGDNPIENKKKRKEKMADASNRLSVEVIEICNSKEELTEREIYHIMTNRWYIEDTNIVKNVKCRNCENYTNKNCYLWRIFNNTKNLNL